MEDVQVAAAAAYYFISAARVGTRGPLMRNRKTNIKRIVARTRPECRTFVSRRRGHCLHIPTRGRAENIRRCVEVA
jgi:hypothetical protein